MAYYNIKLDIDRVEKNITAKTNNSIIYLENIKHTVDSLLIDDQYEKIHIDGLKTVRVRKKYKDGRLFIKYIIDDTYLNISFDNIISYRRMCMRQIVDFKFQLVDFSDLFNKYKIITESLYDIGKPITEILPYTRY